MIQCVIHSINHDKLNQCFIDNSFMDRLNMINTTPIFTVLCHMNTNCLGGWIKIQQTKQSISKQNERIQKKCQTQICGSPMEYDLNNKTT